MSEVMRVQTVCAVCDQPQDVTCPHEPYMSLHGPLERRCPTEGHGFSPAHWNIHRDWSRTPAAPPAVREETP